MRNVLYPLIIFTLISLFSCSGSNSQGTNKESEYDEDKIWHGIFYSTQEDDYIRYVGDDGKVHRLNPKDGNYEGKVFKVNGTEYIVIDGWPEIYDGKSKKTTRKESQENKEFYGSKTVYEYETDKWYIKVDGYNVPTTPEDVYSFSIVFYSKDKIVVNGEVCPLIEAKNNVRSFLYLKEETELGFVGAHIIKVTSPSLVSYNYLLLAEDNTTVTDEFSILKQVDK